MDEWSRRSKVMSGSGKLNSSVICLTEFSSHFHTMARIEAAITEKQRRFSINMNDIAADLLHNSFFFFFSIQPQREDAMFV